MDACAGCYGDVLSPSNFEGCDNSEINCRVVMIGVLRARALRRKLMALKASMEL